MSGTAGASAGVTGPTGVPLDDGGSGSVMAEMLALFTPPGREAKKQFSAGAGTVELHPYYKRPGKGHNHGSCDACGEGGDLICCDNCPASFHFSCHAPPLEEADIPLGDWVCLKCFVRETERLATMKANSQGLNHPLPACSEVVVAPVAAPLASEEAAPAASGSGTTAKLRAGRSRSQKKVVEAALKAEKEMAVKIYKQKYVKYLEVKPFTNSLFDKLIAAAQVVNAEQFKLPDELDPKEKLPFSWKWTEERQDDFDGLPKNCTQCNKTSRNIPSVGCDFCPNIYHLDCLDPPLCEVPRERWMCPMHVEHVLDSRLVSSTSFTERMTLWNKYARKPVDTETVRLDFFRKVRSGKLFQKSRLRIPADFRVKVPQFIKDQYKNRMPGLPAQGTPIVPFARTPCHADRKKDEDEFVSGLISLQSDFLSQQSNEIRREMLSEKKAKKRRSKEQSREKMDSSPSPSLPTILITNGVAKEESDDTASECSIPMDQEDDEVGLSAEIHEQLNAYVARHRASGLENLTPSVRDFLALQRLRELAPSRISNPEHEVQIRAALVPINLSKKSAFMRYRNFSVGLGSTHELDLSVYGHCNYVSNKHAIIYFDQFTQVYEMINYSDYGLVVDNAIYGLDLGSFPVSNRLKSLGQGENDFTMSAQEEKKPCFCEQSIVSFLTDKRGNENSAILHHGSYIRFGCLEFLFSITNQTPERTKAEVVKEEPLETPSGKE